METAAVQHCYNNDNKLNNIIKTERQDNNSATSVHEANSLVDSSNNRVSGVVSSSPVGGLFTTSSSPPGSMAASAPSMASMAAAATCMFNRLQDTANFTPR